jgi:hypothetical protein
VLQPGDVWVIENAVQDDAETDTALKTCLIRGWVVPLESAIPKGRLTPEGRLPAGPMFDRIGPVYRMTEAGWFVVNRSQFLVAAGIIVAVAGVAASLLSKAVG